MFSRENISWCNTHCPVIFLSLLRLASGLTTCNLFYNFFPDCVLIALVASKCIFIITTPKKTCADHIEIIRWGPKNLYERWSKRGKAGTQIVVNPDVKNFPVQKKDTRNFVKKYHSNLRDWGKMQKKNFSNRFLGIYEKKRLIDYVFSWSFSRPQCGAVRCRSKGGVTVENIGMYPYTSFRF